MSFKGQFYFHYICFFARGHIIHRHGLPFIFYADDMQIYLPVRATNTGMLSSPHDCLHECRCHRMFCSKTEIVVIGSQKTEKQILSTAGSLLKHLKTAAKNLKDWFDSSLNFGRYTTKLLQSRSYHLRNPKNFILQRHRDYLTCFHFLSLL